MTSRSPSSRLRANAWFVIPMLACAATVSVGGRSAAGAEPLRSVDSTASSFSGSQLLAASPGIPAAASAYRRGSTSGQVASAPASAKRNGGLSKLDELFRFGRSNGRKQVIAGLPLHRLTESSRRRIRHVVDSPTIFRTLPPQAIDCEQDMFLFLCRNPEVLVGMWDLMGVTNVRIKRVGLYQLEASDGSGTRCTVDLVFGDSKRHIFVASGEYSGSMVTSPIRGAGVFVVNSSYARSSTGGTTVTGSIDCFVKFDGVGADLVARTLSGVIGRSAENNFTQTAQFISQVSQASQRNPPAMVDIAGRLPQVERTTKRRFARTISAVAARYSQTRSAASPRERPFPVAHVNATSSP